MCLDYYHIKLELIVSKPGWIGTSFVLVKVAQLWWPSWMELTPKLFIQSSVYSVTYRSIQWFWGCFTDSTNTYTLAHPWKWAKTWWPCLCLYGQVIMDVQYTEDAGCTGACSAQLGYLTLMAGKWVCVDKPNTHEPVEENSQQRLKLNNLYLQLECSLVWGQSRLLSNLQNVSPNLFVFVYYLTVMQVTMFRLLETPCLTRCSTKWPYLFSAAMDKTSSPTELCISQNKMLLFCKEPGKSEVSFRECWPTGWKLTQMGGKHFLFGAKVIIWIPHLIV